MKLIHFSLLIPSTFFNNKGIYPILSFPIEPPPGVSAYHQRESLDLLQSFDELGDCTVEVLHPLRDVHLTLLHQLGLDDNKLTNSTGADTNSYRNLAKK